MSKAVITVISSDMWMDRPHGASIIRMLEILADLAGVDLKLVVFSWEGGREEGRSPN